ncbi:MAG TPA: tRNA pseudouridine(55) synthase TruB [Candidatus Kapabacteria bacterium]|nr:tRNA pseudouridine(55) synthase TruB [Candidatus Kapabacteria bacterium]
MTTIGETGIRLIDRDDLATLDTTTLATDGGVLLVDKPKGWTSFDVVAKCRGIFRVKKVGHTGTLDPMATGLLVLCFGRATKLVERLQAEEKEYTGAIRFGATTPTDDADSEETETFAIDHLTPEAIADSAASFVGEQLQAPPMFSARKVAGQRLYKLARRGETVEVAPRAITVRAFEITAVDLPEARFRIVCSKGTYIRSLARDLGRALGTGAYLTELRRTRSGDLHVDRAATIDELQATRRTHENQRDS